MKSLMSVRTTMRITENAQDIINGVMLCYGVTQKEAVHMLMVNATDDVSMEKAEGTRRVVVLSDYSAQKAKRVAILRGMSISAAFNALIEKGFEKLKESNLSKQHEVCALLDNAILLLKSGEVTSAEFKKLVVVAIEDL